MAHLAGVVCPRACHCSTRYRLLHLGRQNVEGLVVEQTAPRKWSDSHIPKLLVVGLHYIVTWYAQSLYTESLSRTGRTTTEGMFA